MKNNMSPLQEFVFYRTYSRWVDELGRRETWEEVVARYFDFFKAKMGDRVPKKVWTKVQESVLDMKVMPSMRAIWSAGPALEATNAAGYNCAFVAFSDLLAPSELFYVLMCGAGVGFSVEQQFISNTPVVARQTGAGVGVHVVKDSKEGWADALKAGLQAWFAGVDVEFDYSLVRPRGARLKTMGGRASGPEPLKELLEFVRDTILSAQGRKLTSLEWLDIGNKIAESVVVGGVRRSSEISFSDLEDGLIRHAKDFSIAPFPAHRFMSNNTAVYYGRPDMVTFMHEWAALAKSGAGERGIFNVSTATLGAPRRKKALMRTNPCGEIHLRNREFCVSGDTKLITKNGIVSIQEAVNSKIAIWNGEKWSEVTPFQTSAASTLYRVHLSDGSYLDCTAQHKWYVKDRFQNEFRQVFTSDLMNYSKYSVQVEPTKMENASKEVFNGDAYTLGVAVGDGFVDSSDKEVYIELYGPKKKLPVSGKRYEDKLKSQRVRTNLEAGLVTSLKTGTFDVLFGWSKESVLGFLAGLADTDGSETGTGGIRIYLSGEARARSLQLLLTKNGIRSSVCLMASKGAVTNFGERGEDMWYVQITDCSALPCHRLDVSRGHAPKFKSKYQNIVRVEKLEGAHKTFCFEEAERHKGVFNNVLTGQCNLSEVVVRRGDTFADLTEKVKSAVWLGAMQACLTDFPYLSHEWKDNCEEERLLGVSLTGQMDAPKLMTAERLADLKEIAIKEAAKACKALGINMSAAITTGKPSGTVSQLVDAASGAHPRFAKYYIRRVRISAQDPLCQMLRAQGVPMTPENGQSREEHEETRRQKVATMAANRASMNLPPLTEQEIASIFPMWTEDSVTTWVVSFPEKAPEGAITKDEVTAIDQLEWYKKVRTNWCEHNQSITVYVRENEWLEVGDWVYKNFDIISGVSFLPFDGGSYKQAPYQTISKEEYLEMKKNFPTIDYTQLSKFELDDHTTGAQSLACVGDKCEIV